jgi:hypothetical protein
MMCSEGRRDKECVSSFGGKYFGINPLGRERSGVEHNFKSNLVIESCFLI